MKKVRAEEVVFQALEDLCTSFGFIHAIAYICFRDNIVSYSNKLTSDDIAKITSDGKLIRTEISTLIGLMLKKDIDFSIPKPDILQGYINTADTLMQELHDAITAPAEEIFLDVIKNKKNENPFTRGEFLRELIFYSGDSAYDFQYQELAVEKYINDNDWFLENKAFSVTDVKVIIETISEIQSEKLSSLHEVLWKTHPSKWTLLGNYIFTIEDLASKIDIDKKTIKNILDSFTSVDEKNDLFSHLSNFNIANAKPLILLNENEYISFQHFSILEAFYESPFYWFMEDKPYRKVAEKNRGDFTEDFSYKTLCKVFGEENVYKNIEIYDNKIRVGEIDVLVMYANRAIVLQAKSKKLTLEARKGNDLALTTDFKHAIQDSYEQGKDCAYFIQDTKYVLKEFEDNIINIRRDFKEIFIFCIISDHYPALAFQTQQLLEYEQSEVIKLPFVMDVFLLDIMVEFLSNPLYFLSYINKRTTYFKKFFIQQELTLLSYHLTQNLYLEDDNTIMIISDDVCAYLDEAILSRRKGIGEKKTPEGILTNYKNTIIGNFLDNISSHEDDHTIEIGFSLLTLSEEAIVEINNGVEKAISLFFEDGKGHDFTAGFDVAQTGITIHINALDYDKAYSSLINHCKLRKYKHHANNWFGICIDPYTKTVKCGVMSDTEWVYSKKISEEIVQNLIAKNVKIGRNEKCPCGSGGKGSDPK